MDLITAIKTGRPFRRPCFPEGFWFQYKRYEVVMTRSDGATYDPDKEDILADDWIVQEPKVEISRSQLEAAFREAYSDISLMSYEMIDVMARALGLASDDSSARSSKDSLKEDTP